MPKPLPQKAEPVLTVCPQCGSSRISNNLTAVNPFSAATSSSIRCVTCGYEGLPLQATAADLKKIRFRRV
jgi:predicted RNA-binding Zn-ribbon protein involved in translation (DUF1610 family)